MTAFAMVLLLAWALSACASRHLSEGHGNSPTYAAGYTDGCATASAREAGEVGGEVRDATLFNNNVDYRSGWRAGYASCTSATKGAYNPLDNPFGKP